MVAVCSLSATAGTGTDNVTVGQELSRLHVAILFLRDLFQLTIVIQLAEEVGSELMVNRTRRAAIDIKRDAQLLERFLDDVVIAIHHILRRDTLLAGTQRHRHTVLIRSTNHQHLLALQSEVTCVNIGGHIYASQVSDMNRAIGVGQRRCYQGSFKLFLHVLADFSFFSGQR